MGVGKSFLVDCFASECGLPVMEMGEFRSKWVGDTERQQMRILMTIRALGPVIVVVDEADAVFGTREADGDSGVSGRVFAAFAAHIGDSTLRGRELWVAMTSRPDLLSIDMKRQGRFGLCIPLFPAQGPEDVLELFTTVAQLRKIPPGEAILAYIRENLGSLPLTGSDVESILIRAKERAVLASRDDDVQRADLEDAVSSFIDPLDPNLLRLQELAAVLACSDRRYLPEQYQAADRGTLWRNSPGFGCVSGTGERVRRLERIERVGADGAMLVANDTMMTLPYSLVIEATEDADFFGFYSPDLEGFTGVAHSIEDCLYQARWGMADHVQTLREQSKCGSISRCERGGMSGPQGDAEEAEAGRGVGPGDAGAKDVDGTLAGSGWCSGRGGRRGECAGLFAVVNRCPARGQAPEECVAAEGICGGLEHRAGKVALKDAPGQQGGPGDAAAGLGLVLGSQAPAEAPFAEGGGPAVFADQAQEDAIGGADTVVVVAFEQAPE